MTSKITFADRLQSKDALDKSMQWVTKKGSTPWNPGAFKGLDSLELLSETSQEFRKTKRFGQTSAHAAWGLLSTLIDSVGELSSLLENQEAILEKLNSELVGLRGERLHLLVDKNHYATLMQEKDQQLATALNRAEIAEQKVSDLSEQYQKAKMAAEYLAEKSSVQHTQVSHEVCHKRIQSLEK